MTFPSSGSIRTRLKKKSFDPRPSIRTTISVCVPFFAAPLPLHLMKQALYRIPLIAWSLVVDRWRWDIFAGKVPYEYWNEYWWELREGIQRVRAPVERRGRDDLDPLAKFHINDNTPYMP